MVGRGNQSADGVSPMMTFVPLPLVTAGDSDYVEHDWHTIFSSLGVLQYDTKIAAVVSFLGWCGMLATVGVLITAALTAPAARWALVAGWTPDGEVLA